MAMQTINGMQVLDQTPGMLGGTKTLNVRRTGIYANQAIEGPMMTNPGQPIDSQSKSLLEQNIQDLVGTSSFVINHAPRIENYLQSEQRIEQLKSQIGQQNEEVRKYLKTQYHYEFCTTFISINFKVFEHDPAVKMRILGTNEQEYENFIADIRYELNKFGPIVELKVPRQKSENLEVGKVYVNFLNVASAFACYNLLNSKPYMGQPVDILFINGI